MNCWPPNLRRARSRRSRPCRRRCGRTRECGRSRRGHRQGTGSTGRSAAGSRRPGPVRDKRPRGSRAVHDRREHAEGLLDRSARKNSQPRHTMWKVATIRKPFQQARSTGSTGSIRSQPGLGDAMADQDQAVVDAPEDEGPGGAVPEAAEDHREHQVAVCPQHAAAAAAERDVQVVPQPLRQADVPSGPESLGLTAK